MSGTFSIPVADAMLQALANIIDAGSGSGYIRFYTAPRPTSGAAITSQLLLATCTFANPCGTVAGGQLTLSTITGDSSADADGTMNWARVFDSSGNFCVDYSCALDSDLLDGVPKPGVLADLFFNTLEVRTGGILNILSFNVSLGG